MSPKHYKKLSSISHSPVRKFFPGVKVIKDADQPIFVDVTEQDAKTSKRKKHSECAMAVACKRELKLDGVLIARSKAYLIRGTTAIRYHVPVSLGREVVSFDRGASFEPGLYELSAISPSDAINRDRGGEQSRTSGDHSGRNPRIQHVTRKIRALLRNPDVEE